MANQWTRISSRNKKKMLGVAKKATLAMGRRIIKISPVDTGRFKESWRTSINIPDLSTLGKGGGLVPIVKLLKSGESIYFTNNQPYARRLEFGWSNQAPVGMVRITVADFKGAVGRAVTVIIGSRDSD